MNVLDRQALDSEVLEFEQHWIHCLQVWTDQRLKLHLVEYLGFDVDARGDLNQL